MLIQKRLGVVQFVEGDVDLQVLLRQRHVLIHLCARQEEFAAGRAQPTHFEGVVEVAHLAQRIEESIHPLLVVLDERVQAHHILLLSVRRLVGKVLQHLGDEGERPSRVPRRRRQVLDEHVGLRRDDGGIDEPKEEEAADEGAHGCIGRFGVLALYRFVVPALQRARARARTFVKLLICLQIHRMPYGTLSIESMMVRRKELAISMSMASRGAIMF